MLLQKALLPGAVQALDVPVQSDLTDRDGSRCGDLSCQVREVGGFMVLEVHGVQPEGGVQVLIGGTEREQRRPRRLPHARHQQVGDAGLAGMRQHQIAVLGEGLDVDMAVSIEQLHPCSVPSAGWYHPATFPQGTRVHMRIGHGFDAHRFGDGDGVIIGGERIAHDRSLIAHSDGDVLVHAVCDALLGAAGLGDIGRHFPDTEDQYRGIDSRVLLRRVRDTLAADGMRVANLDCTLVAQAPRMGPHIAAMCANLAQDLGVARERVNVKATTTEGMGYTGRGEGIAAHAVVLLTAL